MKIKSFRIKNYKSIIDSNECRLSDNDNITILAGQNESGKSSILQAIRDFNTEKLNMDCIRDDDTLPEISITFVLKKGEIDIEEFYLNNDFPESFKKIFNNITEFTVTKTFSSDNKCKTIFSVSEELTEKLVQLVQIENELISILNEKIKTGAIQDVERKLYNEDIIIENFISEFYAYSPSIIFFDDFCDLLPDKILINELKEKKSETKGYEAVKNIETILNADFTKLDIINDAKRQQIESTYHETITAKFNEKWKQRIAEGDGAKIHIKYNQGRAENAAYLNFFIETTKGEFLPPSKRSQGFKWFLSFYLQLRAEDESSSELVILFDEPGLYLHSRAQSDMIAVFEELSNKNQIIYSTHSPYLIDTTKLHRLRLILNTKKHGTTIEKITSLKIKDQKDALKPIIDAVGLEVASPFSVAIKNNVILEGISDFHYMQAMKKILDKKYDLGLLPSMGASNAHLLMEICIGWGLNWVIIFDDKGATKSYNSIKKNFFNDNEEETRKQIYTLKDCDGIEDLFTVGDMKLVDKDATFSTDKKNSETVKMYGGKELFARFFYEKVCNQEINKNNLSKTVIKRFEEIFSFIEKTFNLKNN